MSTTNPHATIRRDADKGPRLLWVSLLMMSAVVTPCLSQQTTRFTPIALTNREALLRLTAPTGSTYRIDVSDALPGFTPWLTGVSAGTNQHLDCAAPFQPQRFYRAEHYGATNLLTGDHLSTSNGVVTLHPIDHATFVMTWQDKMIYVDPVGGATRFAGLARPDLILITHGHGDHYHAATLDAVKLATTVILAPQAVYNSMTTALRPSTTVLTNGMGTNLLDLRVDAVPAYNLTSAYHPRGVGNGYVVTVAGKRIYISGDTEDTPELRALRDIDAAFLCMNLPYTMTVEKAASTVREFRPRIVYPYHYSSSDVARFKNLVGQDLGIEVRLRKWY